MTARTPAAGWGRLVAFAALAAAFSLSLTSAAFAKAGAPENATIYIKGNAAGSLKFVGAKKIREGGQLTIINQTGPKVGPQTVSLVEPEEIPKTKELREACMKASQLCSAIAHWHGIKHGGKAKVQLVDVGSEGWGYPGTKTTPGDSWYTGHSGQTLEVTVNAGSSISPIVLSFISGFDPTLHGSITVVPFL